MPDESLLASRITIPVRCGSPSRSKLRAVTLFQSDSFFRLAADNDPRPAADDDDPPPWLADTSRSVTFDGDTDVDPDPPVDGGGGEDVRET
jgi:hypothetical protein